MPEADRHGETALAALAPKDTPPTDAQRAKVDEVRKRLEECGQARRHWIEQRESDREFMESQFSEAQRAYRMRTDRPAVEVHVLWSRVEQMMHDWRAAGMGIRIGSSTSAGGENAARFFNGLLQRDLRESRAPAVFQQIVEDSVTLGEGWGRWAVVRAGGDEVVEKLWDDTEWSVDAVAGVEDRDLRLKYVAPEDCWPDPYAVEPDRRDMQWLIETRWMTREQRDRKFPDAYRWPVESFDARDWGGADWMRGSPGALERDKMLRVAYYWSKREVEREYVFLPHWRAGVRADRLTADQRQEIADAGADALTTRKRRVPIVELTVVDGRTVLFGPVEQPMTRIPYFRSVGNEIRYRNGEVVPRGMVAVLRGLSFWMSVMASDVAWKQAVVGLDFWEVTEDAIEGYRDQWENMAQPADIRIVNQWERNPDPNVPPRDIRAPVYKRADPNLESNMAVFEQVRSTIGAVGGGADQASREERGGWRSAMGLDATERMAANNRMRWVANAQEIMLTACAETYMDMVRRTAGRRGRVVMVGSETPGEPDQGAIIGVPFVHEPGKDLPTPLPGLPDEVEKIPLALPPGPDGQPVQATLKVHRFDPSKDRVKVTTFSAGMTRRTRDSKAEILGNLLTQQTPGPERAILVKSALKAISDVVPMDDVIRDLDAAAPSPVDPADTDVGTLAARNAMLGAQVRQLEEQLQQASAAADQMAGAERIEAMKAEQRAQTAQIVTELKGAIAVEVAKIRAEAQTEAAETEAEGRVEAEVVRQSAASDNLDRKNEADATIAGMKEGARGGGRNPGAAGG